MIESLAVAMIGGGVGAILAYVAFNGLHTATMNWISFSQVTFAFAVTSVLLVQGIVWAVMIGLIGGLFPSLRGARLPIAAALREL
jgi:putative ABC transport system permease protein